MKKSIIITGGAGNLGQAVTQLLIKEGYEIHITLGPTDDASSVAHSQVSCEKVNLLDASESEKFIKNKKGNIEALICIVGGFSVGSIYETTIEDVNKMIALNFATAYNAVQPLLKLNEAAKKSLQIILISSRAAFNAEEAKNEVAYAMSKSLLKQLADVINISTNSTGVSASIIVPSTLDTKGTRNAIPAANFENWVPTQQVANTVKFILSDAGKMMRKPIYKIYNMS